MKMAFLRDIVVPLATLTTLFGCLFFTYKLIELGHVGGSISTGLLTAAIGYFVYYDTKRLLSKIS